jgi:hypothetical protein
MKKLMSLITLFCAFSIGFSQESKPAEAVVRVTGNLKDANSKRELKTAAVEVYDGNGTLLFSDSDGISKYAFELETGKVYDMKYSAPGYMQKILRIDLTGAEMKGSFDLNIDGSLQLSVEGFNQELLKMPIAICSYKKESDGIEFDQEYSDKRQVEIDQEMERLKAEKSK